MCFFMAVSESVDIVDMFCQVEHFLDVPAESGTVASLKMSMRTGAGKL